MTVTEDKKKKAAKAVKKAVKTFRLLIKTIGFTPKKYQKECIEYMVNNEILNKIKGGILADEMGLGKTIQTTGLIYSHPVQAINKQGETVELPTLVIVPPPLLCEWHATLVKVGLEPFVYHRNYVNLKEITQQKIENNKVVLTTYGMVAITTAAMKAGKSTLLHNVLWGRIIWDEAHKLKNPKTNIYQSSYKLTGKSKWLVSGTPVQNKKNDIYALLSLMGYDKALIKKEDDLKGVLEKHMLKRTKSDVGIILPKLTVQTVNVKWSSKAESDMSRELHGLLKCFNVNADTEDLEEGIEEEEEEENKFKDELSAAIMDQNNNFLYLMRCRQVCIYPKLLKSMLLKLRNSNNISRDAYNWYALACSSSSKLKVVCDNVLKNVTGVEGCGQIIFCTFREEMDAISKVLRSGRVGLRLAMLDGRVTSKEERDRILGMPYDVLILQIQTGAEGLNLQKNYNVIHFVTPHWNPSVELQAIARCHRVGQVNEVRCYKYVMVGFDNKVDDDGILALDEPMTVEQYIVGNAHVVKNNMVAKIMNSVSSVVK